jgi:biopolymer transport protein ExbD
MSFGSFDQSGQNSTPMAEINTTPFVDVMLVLLVIFIITAPLLTHAIKLDLPVAAAPPSPEKSETVTISIDGNGKIFWNNLPVSDITDLSQKMASSARLSPQPELQLRADQQTKYQVIAEVMSAAQQAGLAKIGFITDPKKLSEGGAKPPAVNPSVK